MKTHRVLYVGLVILVLAVDCSILDFKVSVSANTDLQDSQTNNKKDPKEGNNLSSVTDSSGVDKGQKTEENQGDDLKEKIVGDTKSKDDKSGDKSKSRNEVMKNTNSNDLNSQSEIKTTDNSAEGMGDLNEKGIVDDGKNGKIVDKEKNVNGGNSGIATKDSHEECDPSNRCIDEVNQLVACIRVQGNDKQSLFVQNRGKMPVTVAISAPEHVQLEKEIQLQAKEDKMVQVSITHEGSDNMIVLKAGKGHCNLDIKHLIAENFGHNSDGSRNSSYINFMTRTPTIVILAFAALLVLTLGWTCISLRRKQLSSSASKYQKLDAELPVSVGVKADSEQNDGWDDKWDDDWDDEEAPKTPSMPVTPSLSSKGLASRRSSKEGWKD
ncbi:uncharacterized protein LOC126678219 [Mercurialis annua]|uniref:uncharacterized protein LOC126678219 n=1 Tax=Mercurialis annua TaxID=3986 RepID=UPI0021601AE9|nr:uncharacterized protein LOC126678219 [Mercurialis annua]